MAHMACKPLTSHQVALAQSHEATAKQRQGRLHLRTVTEAEKKVPEDSFLHSKMNRNEQGIFMYIPYNMVLRISSAREYSQ